jgi:hypothetical protein
MQRTALTEVIRGCLARWFQVIPDAGAPSLPTTLEHAGARYQGSVDLTMINAPVNQDACKGQTPAVLIAAIP